MNIDDYYYSHTNGDLIYKNAIVADDEYFDSPFVKKYWPIDLADRGSIYPMFIDAEIMGARPEQIQELKSKWNVTKKDTQTWADRVGFKLFMDKNQWCATLPTFISLAESLAGFGDTRWEVLVELCREIKKNKGL